MSWQVALVLETDFANKLQEIASQMPIWVVHTKINSALVKKLRWQYPMLELTEFYKDDSESNCEAFYRILPSLDDHYSQLSQELPYKILLVFGLDLDLVDTTVLKEFDFNKFYKTEYSFIAEKVDGITCSFSRDSHRQ